MTVRIDFEPVGRRGECPKGHSLLDCARQLGVDLVNLCGGTGGCGRCIVQILKGEVSEPADGEAQLLSVEELAQGYRLACRTFPLSDCKVRVPPESLTTPQRTQVEGEDTPVEPEPAVQTYTVSLLPPSLDDLRADAERLLDALARQHGLTGTTVEFGVLRQLSPYLREAGRRTGADGGGTHAENWQVRVVLRDQEVVALLPLSARPLGLAVDLGTTKIAVYLLDLASGQTLASEGIMNPQIAYGEDVVARMAYVQHDPSQAARLQELVVDALNNVVAEMCASAGLEPGHIADVVVVGNTAMHHLFLRLPVAQLARAPYVPAVASALDVKARGLGLHFAPGTYVHLLPNIAGYVGADHVAMLLAAIPMAPMPQATETQAGSVVLAIDIGTNTEVCLVNRGALTSTSCASGPAFEGAHIHHGMRAANGAIERLRLVAGQVEYQTIGGGPPVGLCGSGILDALAQLYRAGIVDDRGRMDDGPGVREVNKEAHRSRGAREFVIVAEEDREAGQPAITFTQ
jgi:uncharacterized 2Fe-2S/4Fe-4S cluster protein (DUF4445 family)